MRKKDFYTQYHENGKRIAKLVHGYTDGNLYFYRENSNKWWAIDPGSGLAIPAPGKTRAQAITNAYTPERVAQLEKAREADFYRRDVVTFNTLILEAV